MKTKQFHSFIAPVRYTDYNMHKQRGFTVIELLIVFVIGGLMLLVVFLAVPATRRTAHNNARHKDAGLLLASVTDVRAQSPNAALPASCDSTMADCFANSIPRAYYKDAGSFPAVTYVKLDHSYTEADALLHADDDDAAEKVAIYTYAICNDAGTAPTGQYASPQNVVLQYALETFSGVAMQCKQI